MRLGPDGSYRLHRRGSQPLGYARRLTPESAARRLGAFANAPDVRARLVTFLGRLNLSCDASNLNAVLERALQHRKIDLYRQIRLGLGCPQGPIMTLRELMDELGTADDDPMMETILNLSDETGAPLPEVQWSIALPEGGSRDATSRHGDGGATVVHPSQSGEGEVTIKAIGSLARSGYVTQEGTGLDLLRKDMTFMIPVGTTTRKRLRRPNALVYGLCDYYPGQRTFLPRTILSEDGEVLDNLDIVADFMAEASARSEYGQLVLGHADPSGSSGKNGEITKTRAESAWGFLIGDRDLWLRCMEDDDEQVAMRVLLMWVSERFSWDVHTGDAEAWDERCDAALATYRERASEHLEKEIRESDTITRDDWDAAFALMEEALSTSLLDAPDSLRSLRDQLDVAESRRIGCGDRLSEQDHVKERNPGHDRRVELVLLEDESFIPSDDVLAEHVYGRWIRRVRMPISLRRELRLRVCAVEGHPIEGTPFELEIESHCTQGESTTGGRVTKSRTPYNAFQLDVHQPDPLRAHKLVNRIRVAIENAAPVGLIPSLSLPTKEAESLAEAYEKRFGTTLADDAIQASEGSPLEAMVRALLNRAGLRGDDGMGIHDFREEQEQAP